MCHILLLQFQFKSSQWEKEEKSFIWKKKCFCLQAYIMLWGRNESSLKSRVSFLTRHQISGFVLSVVAKDRGCCNVAEKKKSNLPSDYVAGIENLL